MDISSPINPVRVGNVTLDTGENSAYSVTVSGRYAIVTTGTSPARLIVVELPFTQAAVGEIGSLEAGGVSVQGAAQVGQALSVGTAATVAGSFNSQGPLATRDARVNTTFIANTRMLINSTQTRTELGSASRNVTVFINGTLNATGAITASSGFDIAEAFRADEYLAPGDLVMVTSRDSVKKATAGQAYLTIGAVSTMPGFILDNPQLENRVLVGLAGRIPVNVEGEVQAGDFIAVSDTPGKGKAATEPSFILGRALENSQNGQVMMVIQPGYFSPQVTASGALIGAPNNQRQYGASPFAAEGQDKVLALNQPSDVIVTLE